MKNYKNAMLKCLKLAIQAAGATSPNPMVGCVILNSNDEIISEGFHKKSGANHAERDALLKLPNANGCTLVVNLEPCCHTGKTPPCTDIIIEKGIKRVVYGMRDPNPKVAGMGLKKLENAGIEIIGPVLENECINLNEIFIKNMELKKTFVAIKTATTIDGKIAAKSGDSKWITSGRARQKAKELRKFYDAILTSSSTVIMDNPNMVHSKKIILDRELKTDSGFNIYQQGEIYVFYDEKIECKKEKSALIKYIPAPVNDGKFDIEYILKKLYELNIMSVFVEAGGLINSSFLPYADKLYQFIAPKVLGDNGGKSCFDGKKVDKISECYNLSVFSVEQFDSDILIIYNK